MGSSFILFMLMPFLLLLVLTPDIRLTLGLYMNVCLQPTIGFDFQYPVFTILIAGLVMVVATTLLRHLTTDWMSVGKQNFLQKHVQGKYKEAQGNPVKLKKVQELNAEIMKMTSDRMNSQTKTAMYTMVFSLLLFMWLIVFIYNKTPVHYVSTPWAIENGWKLTDSGAILEFLTGGASKGPMPNWVLLYSLFSLPVGQGLQAGLKYWSFRRMLARVERGEPAVKPFKLFPSWRRKTKVEYSKPRTEDKAGLVVEEGEFEVEDGEDEDDEEGGGEDKAEADKKDAKGNKDDAEE
jgi:uncharacterized membrane protein (DUF106 family)